jgi:hypothetical protein
LELRFDDDGEEGECVGEIITARRRRRRCRHVRKEKKEVSLVEEKTLVVRVGDFFKFDLL